MEAVNKSAKKVLDTLTRGLSLDTSSRSFGRPGDVFMQVHVSWVDDFKEGPIFSVAHYFEQMGDLMADPEMTFLRGGDGEYYPLSYKLDSMGVYKEAVDFRGGAIKGFKVKQQAEMASFANGWMANIKDQQDLGAKGVTPNGWMANIGAKGVTPLEAARDFADWLKEEGFVDVYVWGALECRKRGIHGAIAAVVCEEAPEGDISYFQMYEHGPFEKHDQPWPGVFCEPFNHYTMGFYNADSD